MLQVFSPCQGVAPLPESPDVREAQHTRDKRLVPPHARPHPRLFACATNCDRRSNALLSRVHPSTRRRMCSAALLLTACNTQNADLRPNGCRRTGVCVPIHHQIGTSALRVHLEISKEYVRLVFRRRSCDFPRPRWHVVGIERTPAFTSEAGEYCVDETLPLDFVSVQRFVDRNAVKPITECSRSRGKAGMAGWRGGGDAVTGIDG
ncbi:hypothetical protein BDY17DRAFT_112064 [Neohortaea acidophila]|uniref:Uncharacterized protein n=1 Tax=Neohortaea acidophila TaxID=245834 RepID=A0A6A6Q0N9_9PEZI|nr:uncharacterized protein BDY17DRAFT_112064 [Neohortaea acidophila]KAF2485825.1 hypothetical protein BDY17DRAFT_112064 [Neohortaea acidophila]